jgi:hypothetical protein
VLLLLQPQKNLAIVGAHVYLWLHLWLHPWPLLWPLPAQAGVTEKPRGVELVADQPSLALPMELHRLLSEEGLISHLGLYPRKKRHSLRRQHHHLHQLLRPRQLLPRKSRSPTFTDLVCFAVGDPRLLLRIAPQAQLAVVRVLRERVVHTFRLEDVGTAIVESVIALVKSLEAPMSRPPKGAAVGGGSRCITAS